MQLGPAWVREAYLPLYEAAFPGDRRPRSALDGCRKCLAGEMPWQELNPLVHAVREAAKESGAIPAAQAAARAIATACAVHATPANALGFVFYGAAAAAYGAEGVHTSAARLDELAAREERRILKSLRAAAVENEPCSVEIDWHC